MCAVDRHSQALTSIAHNEHNVISECDLLIHSHCF